MAITNLKVANFKSFKDLDLNLARFNVVVGADAAGKSNFVEVFRFLRSTEEDVNGLDDGISLHGGPGSNLNVRLGLSEPLRIRVTLDEQVPWTGWEDIVIRETAYDFGLRFGDPQDRVSIEHDRFTQKLQGQLDDEEIEARLDISMYDGNNLLANLLSDGTVDVAALIIALFFEDKDVVIIEKPERNIHPHLISGLIELMKDAARSRQVIIATHSPEVVRHAGVENLLLLSRDKEGFSTPSRPAEKQDVKIFLENDLGLDEVFVQELWGP